MKRIFLVVIVLVCNVCSQAMMRFDPQFDNLIQSADLIGVFKVTATATFRARLQPIKILKGKQHDAVWLTGYTDWDEGTSDTLQVGEVYFIFATKASPLTFDTLQGKDMMRAARAALVFAGSRSHGYRIHSATAGKYVLHGNMVYADVTQRAKVTPAIPLELFESFVMQAMSRRESATVSNQLLQHILTAVQRNDSSAICNTIIMMQYAHSTKYYPLFDTLAREGSSQERWILAQLLGQINDSRAYTVLKALMYDRNTFVQFAAVRAITRSAPRNVLGPLLIAFLDPTINPDVLNSQAAVAVMAQAIVVMKYKQALPVLRALLQKSPDSLLMTSVLTDAVRMLQ